MKRFLPNFGENFDTLAAQSQENTIRLVHLEEVEKKLAQDIQKDARKIHSFKRSLDTLWENFEKEINSSKENVEEVTTCLNATPIKAHNVVKALEGSKVAHREAYSTILFLTEGQNQHTQTIKDAHSLWLEDSMILLARLLH